MITRLLKKALFWWMGLSLLMLILLGAMALRQRFGKNSYLKVSGTLNVLEVGAQDGMTYVKMFYLTPDLKVLLQAVEGEPANTKFQIWPAKNAVMIPYILKAGESFVVSQGGESCRIEHVQLSFAESSRLRVEGKERK